MRMAIMVLATAMIAAPAGAQVANVIPEQLTGGSEEATAAEVDAFYACIAAARGSRNRFHLLLRPYVRKGAPMAAQRQSDIVGEAIDASETCRRQHGDVRYNVRRMFDALMAAGPPPAMTPQP